MIDLSPLNQQLQNGDYSIGHNSSQGGGLHGIDRRCVPTNTCPQVFQKILRFVLEDKTFQFKCLCFGLATKSDLRPSQSALYLGMKLETAEEKMFPAPARIEKPKRLIKNFKGKNQNTARDFQVILGALASMEKLVPGGRNRTRAMQWQLRNKWNPNTNPLHLIPHNPQILLDLGWWVESKTPLKGAQIGSLLPQVLLFTDASTEGWGAHFQQQKLAGRWTGQEKKLHINVLEITAVRLALQFVSPGLKGQRVGIMSDNSSGGLPEQTG